MPISVVSDRSSNDAPASAVLRNVIATCLLGLFVSSTLTIAPASAIDGVSEQELKVGFLLNFAKYTESRDSAPAPFRFCVWRENTLGNTFPELSGRLIRGQKVMTAVVGERERLGECRALYVPENFRTDLAELRSTLRAHHILSISEQSDESILSFTKINSRLRFDCNAEEARMSGLKLSAQLLKLANRVIPASNDGGSNEQ